MDIKRIENEIEKNNVARFILESLEEWFGIEEAREEYILNSKNKIFFCAVDDNRPIGFVYLKETGVNTVELAVMGVLKEYHRKGVGTKLFAEAKRAAFRQGYSFIQVKTVQEGKYRIYDDTNKFYRSLGFKEFEVFPTLWDENNPCQIYIMALQ